MSIHNLSTMALIAMLLLSAPGCSDSSPTSSELCIEFDGAQAAAAGRVTSRLGADSGCEEAVVEIVATDLLDVFGVATTITYDPEVATYGGRSTIGSVLGADLLVDIEEDPIGTLTVGVTRVSATGVNVTGTAVLMKLFFEIYALDPDSGSLTLEDNCLVDSGEPPLPKPGVTCSGGTLAVR